MPVGDTPRSTPRIRALPKILSLHFLLRALFSVKSKLWIALPPELELSPPVSVYQAPEEIQREGPALALLGSYGAASTAIKAPSPVNILP